MLFSVFELNQSCFSAYITCLQKINKEYDNMPVSGYYRQQFEQVENDSVIAEGLKQDFYIHM